MIKTKNADLLSLKVYSKEIYLFKLNSSIY